MITDRNGEILALSLPMAGLYANPKEMMDTAEAAARLKQVLPRLDIEVVRARLSSGKQFVYLARNISPREELAINNLGIPGVYFQPTERRRYPQGRVAAHVVGGVDVDAHGVAGVERFFDQRLREDPEPLRLSIDVRVQGAVRDELLKSMTEFQAIGACGIVMDVRTGEVIAMVSLPDYDANKAGEAKPEERFNRAVTGMYEPGSTFKLQTAAMALDSGIVHLWSSFDASHDIKIGRFTISDFEGKHRVLMFPEVIAYSSNLGAAHMAQQVGGERQRTWLHNMGMFGRIGVELPEAGQPIVQKAENWKEIATMTVGFGHGIAVSPLHVRARHGSRRQWRHRPPPHHPRARTRHGRAGRHPRDAAIHQRRHAQADAPGRHGRLRQARGGPGLLRRRKDRDGGEGHGARLQETREHQRLHERLPDERPALRRLLHAR